MSAAPSDPVRAAVDELRGIRSTDPCAALAMSTLKATIHTLETRWLQHPPAGGRPPRHEVVSGDDA